MKPAYLAFIASAAVLLSGCLAPQQALDIKVRHHMNLNEYLIKNNGRTDYTQCMLKVNGNWTYSAERLKAGEEAAVKLSNFTKEDGTALDDNAIIESMEVYCNEGYFGGTFE